MKRPPAAPTVRDEALTALRACGLTTVFGNPGSTEVPFLVDLPEDFQFVLALHEASAVGIATGWALARDRPALALLHTAAGLGNAVGALATARANNSPLVVVVGQQDRRHLAMEPFLAGRLHGLAGEYPVWSEQPARAQDVPSALYRACHEATTAGGPALVIVPMDDWLQPADLSRDPAAARRVLRPRTASPDMIVELTELVAAARAPAIVAGAGADDAATWQALTSLAECLACPVWQEPFGARAGFPQDHQQFAGHLPPHASGVHEALADRDLVLVMGTAAFRQYPYEPGRLAPESTRVVVVTIDPAQAHRSAADLAIVAAPGPLCAALAERLPARSPDPIRSPVTAVLAPPAADDPMVPGHVFDALASRLPREAILVEETPSSRNELQQRVPARHSLGFLSAAMGGLGFALPAAIGARMALPGRPVVAVLGDGSSLYSPQALWTAVHHGVGVLVLVLRNGGYAIMDRLADLQGGIGPWPTFPEIDMTALAASFGCEATRVGDHSELLRALERVLPGLANRTAPLVLEIPVTA